MRTQWWKRCFALFLTFVMVAGMVPVQAAATETEAHDHVQQEESTAQLQSDEIDVETESTEAPTSAAETEAEPATEAPAETEAAPETTPAETEAVVETEAVETEPVIETEPAETEAETQPVQTEAVVETEAVETEPEETTAATEETVEEETVAEETITGEEITEEAAAAAIVNVTVTFNSSLGSVAAGTAAVTSGQTAAVDTTVGLTATANSGATFLGWVNAADNKILSTSAAYLPTADAEVIAAFASASTDAWFRVGKTYLYNDLSKAVANSQAASQMVILAADGTLPAGNYTVPSGVTLLIPFDSADTCYTEVPGAVSTGYAQPTAYRTLNMASGANLTVNGAMSLSAKHHVVVSSVSYGGSPTGPCSFVKMSSGSTITVNGTLYAYGYITGGGSVTINSTGAVYENFQITDFRGGSATLAMADSGLGVFPLSQYYVQNVEVAMKLYAGATEYSYTTLYMLEGNYGSSVAFIGSDGAMFNLKTGYVTKRYDGATDRLVVEANGEMDISPIVMQLAEKTSVNSGSYVLPINGNMTVKVNSDSAINIKQSVAMLPGAQIEIAQGASCTLTADAFIYDAADWGNYCGSANFKFAPLAYAPGRTYNRTEADLVDAKIVAKGQLYASSGHVYTTSGGAEITGADGAFAYITPGTKAVTYQVSQYDTTPNTVEIAVTPAKLKNEDGTYTATAEASGYYKYLDGRWHTVACGAKITTTVTKEPSCTEVGKQWISCGCTAGYEEEIPMLDHTEVTVKGKSATCEEPGLKDGKKCSVCGKITVEQEVIPAGAHVWGDLVENNAATCIKAGTGYYRCTICGDYKDTEIEMLPHTEVTVEAVEATCTKKGTSAYTMCSECNTVLTQPTETELAEHSYVASYEEPASCTADGYGIYSCSVCGDYKEEVLSATGHTKETIPGTAATCTKTGLTDGVKCSVCGDILTAQTETPIKDHTAGEAVEENRVEATCTAAGSYDSVVKCKDCGAEMSRTTKTISAKGHTEGEKATCTAAQICTVCETELNPALGHNYVGKVTEEATCTAAGVETYTCSNCGDSYTKEIPMADHTWETVVKDPTCEETGVSAETTCSVCGAVSQEGEEIPALGHAWNDGVITKAANCTTEGTMTYTCTRNGCGKTKTESITALGHNSNTTLTGKDATCTETGLTEGKKCSVCGTVTVEQTTIPATGHKEATLPGKPATCENTGLTEEKKCSVCGTVTVKQTVIDAIGHDWDNGDVTTAPKCEQTGVRTYTCGNDAAHTKTESIEATGHTEETLAAVAANCTETGLTEGKKCSVCLKITVAQEEIPAKGHTEETIPAVEPTCTADGLTEGKKCSVCGTITEEQSNVRPNGHTPAVDDAVDATCTETGLTEGNHCSVCDEVLTAQEVVPALGHTEIIDAAVAATCTATGLTEGKHCSACNEVLTAQEEVPMLEHDWGTGRVTTDPTCTEEGVREFTCAVCLASKQEVEPAAGHKWIQVEAQRPTYTEYGWEAYEYCEVCAETTIVMLDPLGEPVVETYAEFIENLKILEDIAEKYTEKRGDPLELIINYIRTGVDRYNSGSWQIMAGYENTDFTKYVAEYEKEYNAALADGEELMAVTGLRNIEEFYLPNGDFADLGHMFGTMDITYSNSSNADVGGWGGDTCDLLSLVNQFGITATTVEGMVAEINEKYFLRFEEDLVATYGAELNEGTFSQADVYGDLDAYYLMQKLSSTEYENGTLTSLISGYMTASLTMEQRAEYFLNNRLGGVSLRVDVRDAIYDAYMTGGAYSVLEGTRDYSLSNLEDVRKACCYAFADYLCKLAGDYVDDHENIYYKVYDTESSTLAPGITQKIHYATTADNNNLVYYLATADVTRSDVEVYANYNNNDPSQGWGMQRVMDQANAAQAKYGDPASDKYIENYKVIAAVNGAGYNMQTGEPSGLLVMLGTEYHPSNGMKFFGILTDGSAKIGTHAEYEALKAQGKVREAISAFGTPLIENGKISITATSDYYSNRASRTAVGITASGKVVFMVADGRQGEFSCGGSMEEIAQIMLEAGCVEALNLDGGGSTTFVARPEGEDELAVINSPSDGVARSVSTSLMMVSTAPSSTAFDHAVLEGEYAYFTVGSSSKFYATAVSATGNGVEMPEGTSWAVSDSSVGTIDANGVFTAVSKGTTTIQLLLDGKVVGTKQVYVVTPNTVYFDKTNIYGIYGEEVTLPIRAKYDSKPVAITEKDVILSLENASAGKISGFKFIGNESVGLKKVKINAALAVDTSATDTLTITMYSKDEASFDFDNASGGDRQLAWLRTVSNATEESTGTYRAEDTTKAMVTSYAFGIDMSQIEIPAQLESLTYMLPGADLEGASAWTFLMQLAERVSVMTEVKPVIKFDSNFNVDYSGLTVATEYFSLTNTEFNSATNELTLTLNFIDQTEPIDADTANPLCIVSGLKLTPKSNAAWTDKNQLNVVNSGKISYKICLRTSTLYSFSQKEENQKVYGLYPYENPNDESDRGGAFSDVYKEFSDSYVLINAKKDGWTIEDGGYAYYVNGERVTGLYQIDGYYYNFGTTGINAGQKTYTGSMTDASGNEYYISDGVKWYGWMVRGAEVRYYNESTGIREKLTKKEVLSTCLVDGYCDYTSESGATKHVDYYDASGHEYAQQSNGSYVCIDCGYVRIEMADADVKLSYYVYNYNGEARMPSTTVTAADGRVLAKSEGTVDNYYVVYENNVDVGTASVVLTAVKNYQWTDKTAWRGNAAGTVTVNFEIRPDLPTDIITSNVNGQAVMSWTAALAPDVTYVLYKSTDNTNWTEFATTKDTSYTFNPADFEGCVFKIGTRKVVDGKTYESSSLSYTVYMGPSITSISTNNDGKPTMRWSTIRGASKYVVYRSNTGADGTWTRTYTTDVTYTDNSAAVDNTYYYKVAAVFENSKESVPSAVVSASCVCGKPNVSVTLNSNKQPYVSWSTVIGAKSYAVFRKDTEKGTFTRVATVTTSNYTDTTAVAGKTYYYQIVAFSSAEGRGLASDTVSVEIVIAKPYFIQNVVAGPHVYWKEVAGISKYGLWRSETGKNGTYKWIANPTVPHFTDVSVESGKTYFYRVTTIDPTTNKHSSMSDPIGIVYVNTPDITTRFNKGEGVQLGWEKIEGATGYGIYRKSFDGDDAWVRIGTVEGNETFTWMDKSVKNANGTVYRYTIRALAGSDMKTLSGCRNTGRTMVRLSSRVLNSATKAGATSIKCNWTTSSVVTGYEVRFMVGNEVYKTITIGNPKTGTRIFKDLPAGQTYKVQVRAYKKVDGVGSFYSAWSVAKYVTL